jgi:hypothetical protein
MSNTVKAALRNLQDIFDEGFITQAEFNSRRNAIIDGATAIEPITSSSASGPKPGPAEGSVFSRLGGGSDGDAKRPSGGGADAAAARRSGKNAPAGGGDLRSVLGPKPGISKAGRTDLRAVMSKVADGVSRGGQRGGGRGGRGGPRALGRGGRGLPEECPW